VTTITFTGGLGAQILSAAAYFYLEKRDKQVRASLDYFKLPPRIAKPGNKGEISIWKWELGAMSIFPERFDQTSLLGSKIIHDGEEKLQLALKGLSVQSIRDRFFIVEEAKTAKEAIFGSDKYICAHVRRGDYTNVASFLMPDGAFIKAISMMTKIVTKLLVVTDTEPNTAFMNELRSLQIETHILVGGDVAVTHGLMRLSDILICSNSQLSYTAAALRPSDVLTFMPTKHEAGLNSPTNKFLNSVGDFQIATRLLLNLPLQ
jgi:hypothetical protein